MRSRSRKRRAMVQHGWLSDDGKSRSRGRGKGKGLAAAFTDDQSGKKGKKGLDAASTDDHSGRKGRKNSDAASTDDPPYQRPRTTTASTDEQSVRGSGARDRPAATSGDARTRWPSTGGTSTVSSRSRQYPTVESSVASRKSQSGRQAKAVARGDARLRARVASEGTAVHPADLDDALCVGALIGRSNRGETNVQTQLPYALDDVLLQEAASGELWAVRRCAFPACSR